MPIFHCPTPLLIAAVVIAAGVISCTHNSTIDSYPRPFAYPRLQTYDSCYTAAPLRLPLNFEINSRATFEPTGDPLSQSSEWFDIIYPELSVKVYTTVLQASDPTEAAEIIANRRQRMELNAGDIPTEWAEVTSSDGRFKALMAITRIGSLTPVQFVAWDGKKWVISATAHFTSLTSPITTDSLSPAIDMLSRDMLHAINTLSLP